MIKNHFDINVLTLLKQKPFFNGIAINVQLVLIYEINK